MTGLYRHGRQKGRQYSVTVKIWTMPDATGTTRESDPSVLAKTQEQTLVNEGREIRWTPDKGQFLNNTTQTQAIAGIVFYRKRDDKED